MFKRHRLLGHPIPCKLAAGKNLYGEFMSDHEKIDYVELPANDLNANKLFFEKAFGWEFEDFGEEYTAFSNQGVDGGFYQSDLKSSTGNGAALVVFFSDDLTATQKKVTDSGGTILRPIFSFPGGERFHFSDPCGNEYAVWAKPASSQ